MLGAGRLLTFFSPFITTQRKIFTNDKGIFEKSLQNEKTFFEYVSQTCTGLLRISVVDEKK